MRYARIFCFVSRRMSPIRRLGGISGSQKPKDSARKGAGASFNVSKFVASENTKFEHFFKPLECKVAGIREAIFADYIRVSEALESQQDGHIRDISGSYEYYSCRKNDENYCNIYRKRLDSMREESVFSLDALSKVYGEALTLLDFKLSQCHTLAGVLVELQDSGRSAIVLKDIARNVVCEVDLSSAEACPVSIDLMRAAPSPTSPGSLYLFVTSSLDGVRPSHVHRAPLQCLDLFGSSGWSAAQRLRTWALPRPCWTLVVLEHRPSFFLSTGRSKDNRWLFTHHQSKTSTEVTAIDLTDPASEPITLKVAVDAEQLFVEHTPGYFYAAHRSGSGDLEIKRLSSLSESEGTTTPHNYLDNRIGSTTWEHVWPTAQDRSGGLFVEDYDLFERHMVVYGRRDSDGGLFLQLIRLEDGAVLAEHTCASLARMIGTRPTTLTPRANGNYRSDTAAFAVSSPILPEASFSLDLSSGRLILRQVVSSPCLEEGSASRSYACEKLLVPSEGGYSVPVLLCGPRNDMDDGAERVDVSHVRPTILHAYGSYGVSIPTHYLSEVSIYIQRGWNVAFVFARGGGELGKKHHAAGSKLHKWNTFADFKAAADYLISAGYTTPSLLCGAGSSAGGLVMGVALNHYHHLFAAILMRNPFLGIYEAVQNPESALVVHEYDEWGDTSAVEPGQENSPHKVLQYIKSYSPLDNIDQISRACLQSNYPAVYLTLGLCDNKVNPTASMQWTHSLRARLSQRRGTVPSSMEANGGILVRIQPGVGHDGPATVEGQIEEAAMEIAFLESVIRK